MPNIAVDEAKVKAAVEADPNLKPLMAELFPELFPEENKYLKFEQYAEKANPEVILRVAGDPNAIQIRQKKGSKFDNRGLFLNTGYVWSIIVDPKGGCQVLVAEKK